MSRRKDPAAVKLGRRGAKVSNAKRTPQQREEYARLAADARWSGHEYSTTPGAIYQRKRRGIVCLCGHLVTSHKEDGDAPCTLCECKGWSQTQERAS